MDSSWQSGLDAIASVSLPDSYSLEQMSARDERSGFRLVGIVPGHDRCEVAPGEIKRVYDALYAKLLVAADRVAGFAPNHARIGGLGKFGAQGNQRVTIGERAVCRGTAPSFQC